ncbi:MAG: MBL fold metallo-hydrolase [Chromatiales bacterium]
MVRLPLRGVARFCIVLLALAAAASHAECPGSLAVQVLGSGGPRTESARASSGYLIWIDGRSRALIDAGGGTFVRFGESGAAVRDLEFVFLTHLHADHAAELPALLKSAYFSPRRRALTLIGPTAGGSYPDLEGFLSGLFGTQGAFRYLGGYLDGSDGLFRLERVTLDAEHKQPGSIEPRGGMALTAMGVTHGPVPALALRVEHGGGVVVFSGDQNGDDPAFERLAQGADVLIMDYAVPEDAGPVARNLHALPSEIGRIAHGADVRHLVLSHLMPRSENALAASLAGIRKHYNGPISVARDLTCIDVVAADQQR